MGRGYGAQEDGGAWAISGCDVVPVLKASGRDLDATALFVQGLMGKWVGSGSLRRDTGGDVPLCPVQRKWVAVAAVVGDQLPCLGQQGRRMPAPFWSFICPSESVIAIGPWPRQTAWSLEFSLPLVRPMHRPEPPLEQAGCGSARLEALGVDGQPAGLSCLTCESR